MKPTTPSPTAPTPAAQPPTSPDSTPSPTAPTPAAQPPLTPRAAIKRHLTPLIALFVLVVAAVIGLGLLHRSLQPDDQTTTIFPDEPSQPSTPDDSITPDNSDQSDAPSLLDLQPVVDQWVAETRTNSRIDLGVMIYDLDHQATVGSYQPDAIFNAASIYKLFYVYDGYREIAAGRADADAYFTTTAKGDLTLGVCLDLMIRESYNGCADLMYSDPERTARVETLIADLDLAHTSAAGLYSSARDLIRLLQLYWEHPDLTADQWLVIQDSMLNQPATPSVYNPNSLDDWRQGLPAGFTTATVYDKVGWAWNGSYWSVYNDAAIVVFPEQNRHYLIVVLTEGLDGPTPTAIVHLGQLIESAVLSAS